jgi:5-methyltetrahydropteroyltriglutamate--homocysteine methyltransferase
MGVVSTKRDEVEAEEELVARIDEASRHVDVGQLALTTQCGFASASEGNELDEDSQWRKLEVIGRTADRIWGR